MRDQVDAVVVGGGIAGASCLYHLSQHGLSAVLLEGRSLAGGSTGRSTALIETAYADQERVELGLRTLGLIEVLGIDFTRCGKLLLAHDERELDAFRAVPHPEASVLVPAQIAEVAPELRLDGVAGALYAPGDGYLDPVLLCGVLVERSGLEARQGTEVLAIKRGDGAVTGVSTTTGEICCRAVVNAAGAWAGEVAALAGVDLDVRGYRRQVAVLEPARDGMQLPIVVDKALYVRSDGPERVLAGIHSEEPTEPADPDDFRETSDAEFEEAVARLLTSRLRRAGDLRLRGGWAGLYPIAGGGRPVVGESPQLRGFFNLAGLGGNGIQLGPALAEDVAADVAEMLT
ncbi:MAG TPA: FAD-binding oxidoreductase [Gaiellaceae bacterium]